MVLENLENAPQGKRQLRRPKQIWEDRIQEYVEKVRLGMDWKELSGNQEANFLDGRGLKGRSHERIKRDKTVYIKYDFGEREQRAEKKGKCKL